MKHIIYSAIATISIAAMFASVSVAQVRRSGGTTTENSTTTQTRRSSGGNTSSGSTVRRSSGSNTSGGSTVRRSSGTNSSSSGSGSTVRRSSGTSSSSGSYSSPQDNKRSSGGTVRRSSGGNTGSGSTVRRSSGTNNGSSGSGSTVRRSSGSNTGSGSTVRRSSGTSSSSGSNASGGSTVRRGATVSHDNVRSLNNGNQDNTVRRSAATSNGAGQTLRSNNNVTRRGLGTVNESMSKQSEAHSGNNDIRDFSGASANQARRMNGRYDDYYIDDNRNVMRIHPRERDIIYYDRLGNFYGSAPRYFGYRVSVLPPHYRRVRYYGIDYYYYNDVYYRPYDGYYVVCRPPFGISFNARVGGLAFATVNFAFYSNVYRSYRGFDLYSDYIDRQNMTIARNNAIIASQNNYIAMNLSSAQNSYTLANRLGLVQSYAYANQEYYYQDGVFYIMDGNQYQVIVPPAGALVDELPEDYGTINLNGVEYYRVDDTVYRVTLINGRPMLEVLGQMYGSMARKYSLF